MSQGKKKLKKQMKKHLLGTFIDLHDLIHGYDMDLEALAREARTRYLLADYADLEDKEQLSSALLFFDKLEVTIKALAATPRGLYYS